MIAVDSSVWIDYFNGRTTPQTDRLHEALGEQPIVIGDLVLTEVLQGFRSEALFRRAHRLRRSIRMSFIDKLDRARASSAWGDSRRARSGGSWRSRATTSRS